MQTQCWLLIKELTASEGLPLFTQGAAQELPLIPSLSNSGVATVTD